MSYHRRMHGPSNSKPGRQPAWRIASLLEEEAVDIPLHERSPVIGSPATPTHGWAIRLAYALVAVLLGTTAGLGNALVAANMVQLQRVLELSAAHMAWLATSYVMAAASANLVLIKIRQQCGLRRFSVVSLSVYATLALAHLFVTSFSASLLLRAASGFVAVALIPLCIFNMMQAFPAKWRLKGLVLAVGITQCAMPLAYVLSPSLLATHGWRSLFLLEAGLALLSLAAAGALRFPPAERTRRFQPLDLLTYTLMGAGLALTAAVLGLGRWLDWFAEPWIVAAVIAAPVALLAGFLVERQRQEPLLNISWLSSGDVARFALAIFLIRMVLTEQDIAIAAARALGATTHQLSVLTFSMLLGAATGVLASTISISVERIARPMMLAVGMIAVATLLVSAVVSAENGIEHMPRFYLGQAAIAFAGTFFLGPALLFGITSALQRGNTELISFIVLFGILNALGALAGQAVMGSYGDWRQAAGVSALSAQLDTLRLAAGLAGGTTAYLAILLGMRIRLRLIALREQADANMPAQPPAGPPTGSSDSGWRPPLPHPVLAVACVLIAATGLILILAAWGIPWDGD